MPISGMTYERSLCETFLPMWDHIVWTLEDTKWVLDIGILVESKDADKIYRCTKIYDYIKCTGAFAYCGVRWGGE